MSYKTNGYREIDVWRQRSLVYKVVDINCLRSKITRNNTPPATRKISALRGVTCFWGTEK
ncbi:hypothetical protein HNQ57_003376 [Zhongshania antarctica]|jgi:hypothetical protein|uniref:Uncharacterized protein n=1 Tax=Zhongshania antarctica TaxID=641702 RepID=A0A840R9D6_9GAMM|nr:hypothetical protein [Zhongshania antarctica]